MNDTHRGDYKRHDADFYWDNTPKHIVEKNL